MSIVISKSVMFNFECIVLNCILKFNEKFVFLKGMIVFKMVVGYLDDIMFCYIFDKY